MNKFTIILMISLFGSIFFSCKKNDSIETTTLVGKWKLTEIYLDPGDGTGKFVKVNGGKILEFSADGEVSSNSSLCSMISNGFMDKSTYTIVENSDQISFLKIEKCPTDYSFALQGNQLTIYYSCIEGCGERFMRIRD